MGNSLKCDLCDKPATVHLTQIVNNQIHKLDLCESCAAAKGVTDPSGFSLADLLVKGGEPTETLETGGIVCEHCGFTQKDFKRLGRLGCPSCYDRFMPLLEPVLANMHKGVSHLGKVPAKALQRRSLQDRISGLESKLQEAVAAENYEEAARFRDEIKLVRDESEANSVT
jgi:protein arginine kinase activator